MKKLAIFLLVLLLALLAWRGYEYNDMRHHLRKLHDGMTYAEVRKALPTFLVKEELNPCSQHSRYDFWMTLATPGCQQPLYFDKDLILRAPLADLATNTPAAEETHAENAESAESGSPAGGAGERSETEGVSHAENAETAEP